MVQVGAVGPFSSYTFWSALMPRASPPSGYEHSEGRTIKGGHGILIASVPSDWVADSLTTSLSQ